MNSTLRDAINELNKSAKGPGSRGGTIIGKTKRGKPVYDDPHHPKHRRFGFNDHMDAGDLHFARAKKSSLSKDQKTRIRQKGQTHYIMARDTK